MLIDSVFAVAGDWNDASISAQEKPEVRRADFFPRKVLYLLPCYVFLLQFTKEKTISFSKIMFWITS